ncbi:sce7725 family protein [Flagellimonas marinaquae]|nr:sce7725 family protein [Allomuricauda aquimarina]
MKYFPYFRGKQYELIAIRESAQFLYEHDFVPIIEPVKKDLKSLEKVLKVTSQVSTKVIVIVNPSDGDLKFNGNSIQDLLDNKFANNPSIIRGVLLTEGMSSNTANQIIEDLGDCQIALIHAGFSEAKTLAMDIADEMKSYINVFFQDFCGKLYIKHFVNSKCRVLLRDGFHQRRNRDHPQVEFFSDLHATYIEENMNGFGDFLMVGDEYSESGGPAYTIAIHITYIDGDKDDAMFIHHFKSDRQDTPKDPAGKFAEALDKLVEELNDPHGKILGNTSAMIEFKDLHLRGHFPGLGYVKKLSMKHHIETLGNFFGKSVNAQNVLLP